MAMGMTNPAVAAQLAQKLTVQELSKAAQGAHQQIPPYVAASELMRRKDIQQREQGMQAMAESAQDRSVLEELLDGQEINPGGIGSLPALSMPQGQGQQQETPQPPAQGMPVSTPPNGQGFAAGGLVAFDDGGAVLRGGARGGFMHDVNAINDWMTGKRGWADSKPRPQQYPAGLKVVGQPDQAEAEAAIPLEAFGGRDSPYNFAPLPKPPAPALGSGLRTLYSPQPVSSELPSFLDSPPEVKTLEQYAAERKALLPEGQPYDKLAEEAAALKEQIASRRSGGIGEALLQTGAAMASSRSPYFMQALGEGAQSGLASFQSNRKEIDQLDRLRVQYGATIEQARRAEAIGNIDKAQDMHKHAEDLAEKYKQLQTVYAYHDIGSQRALQGHLAQAQSMSERTVVDRDLMHQDRVAAMEERVYMDAYKSVAAALKDDPKAMMFDESQKEEIAKRRARSAVADFRATQGKSGGITDIPAAGRPRGRIDSSGNLVQ